MSSTIPYFLLILACLGLTSVNGYAKRLGNGHTIAAAAHAPVLQMPDARIDPPADAIAAPAAEASPPESHFNLFTGLVRTWGLDSWYAQLSWSSIGAMALIVLLCSWLIIIRACRPKRAPSPVHGPLLYAGSGPELQVPAGYETQPPPLRPVQNFSEPDFLSEQPLGRLANTLRYPPGFEPEPFLQGAKAAFLRIQKAVDRPDFDALSDLLTPEMLSDTKQAIGQRSAMSSGRREIVSLDAELVKIISEGLLAWAGVRFFGVMRAETETTARPFDEVWNLQRPLSGDAVWRLSGIQQLT